MGGEIRSDPSKDFLHNFGQKGLKEGFLMCQR